MKYETITTIIIQISHKYTVCINTEKYKTHFVGNVYIPNIYIVRKFKKYSNVAKHIEQ